MTIGIIILTRNFIEHTKNAINSLLAHPPSTDYKIHINDCASNDGTQDYIRSLPFDYTLNDSWISATEAANLSIRYLKDKYNPDYFFFLHNDMVLTPIFFDRIIHEINRHQKCLLLGCANIVIPPDFKYTDHIIYNISDKFRQDISAPANLPPWLLKTSALDIVGYFDQDHFIYECSDCDYLYRIEQAGYEFLGTNNVIVFHNYSLSRLIPRGNIQKAQQDRISWKTKYPEVDMNKYNNYSRKYIFFDDNAYLFQGV